MKNRRPTLRYFWKIWTFMGLKMALCTLHTQFTHVSRHFWASNRKQKKLLRKNCFENMVSDMWQKLLHLSIKWLWKKSVFFFKVVLLTNLAIFQKQTFFVKSFYGQMQLFFHKSETIFSKQFSLSNFFSFLFEAQECLEIYVNCVWNVRNAIFFPHEGPNLKKYFFQTSTPPSSEMLDLFRRCHF